MFRYRPYLYRRWRRPFFRPRFRRPRPMFWRPGGCGCMLPLLILVLLAGFMFLGTMCSRPHYWY